MYLNHSNVFKETSSHLCPTHQKIKVKLPSLFLGRIYHLSSRCKLHFLSWICVYKIIKNTFSNDPYRL